MKAKELVKLLEKMIKDNGNKDVMLETYKDYYEIGGIRLLMRGDKVERLLIHQAGVD